MARRVLEFAALATVCVLALGLVATAAAVGTNDAAERRTVDDEASARPNAPRPSPSAVVPFETPEELIYEGEFSRLIIRGVKIAEFRFTAARGEQASPATVAPGQNGTSVAGASALQRPLIFTAEVNSRGWFQKLFGINFHYRTESTVEPASFNVLRTTTLDEQGKRVRTSETIFDRVESRISWTQRDPNDPQRPPRVVQAPLDGASHDLITAIYFLRTQKLTPGQSFELVISDSGAVYRVPVSVFAEKKRMKSIVGKVAVVRVEIGIFGEDRLVKENGQMSLWMTDDARRLPIRARISSEPGTIDITLKKISPGSSS